MKDVPLVDLRPQYDDLRSEFRDAIDRVCDSQRFILGPEVEALEEELADYLEVAHAVGVSSGTDALLVTLMALDVGPGDEVVTTPFSFFATAGTIARLGATPVFVDIDPTTLNIDPEQALDAIGDRTRALLPVHLFGRCSDTARLREELASTDVHVIEDAAQAIGARDGEGRMAGSIGNAGCFSFFPSKNLGCFGDGGMVTTDDDGLAVRVRKLRVHGAEPKYHHDMVGGNFRLDELQAAVLRVKLPHLDVWTETRREAADTYRTLIRDCELGDVVDPLPHAEGHVYNQFVVRTPQRDRLREHLEEAGVSTAIYYPVPLHLQECFRDLGYEAGDFPNAEAAAEEALALPIYPGITADAQSHVIRSISEYFDGRIRQLA